MRLVGAFACLGRSTVEAQCSTGSARLDTGSSSVACAYCFRSASRTHLTRRSTCILEIDGRNRAGEGGAGTIRALVGRCWPHRAAPRRRAGAERTRLAERARGLAPWRRHFFARPVANLPSGCVASTSRDAYDATCEAIGTSRASARVSRISAPVTPSSASGVSVPVVRSTTFIRLSSSRVRAAILKGMRSICASHSGYDPSICPSNSRAAHRDCSGARSPIHPPPQPRNR